jgi:hypothetical protein
LDYSFVCLSAYNKLRISEGSFRKEIYTPVLEKSDGLHFGQNFRTITGTLQVDPHEVQHAKFIGWGIPMLLCFPFLS